MFKFIFETNLVKNIDIRKAASEFYQPEACQVCQTMVGPATKKAKNVAGPTAEWRTWHG